MLPPGKIWPGTTLGIPVVFTNATGVADPSTVTFQLKSPSGQLTTYVFGANIEIKRYSTGNYTATVHPDEPGRWHWLWRTTGKNISGVTQGNFVVQYSVFPVPTWEPLIGDPLLVYPAVGELTITGPAPVALAADLVISAPTAGLLALTGPAPVIGLEGGFLTIPVDVGQLTLAGPAPEVTITGGALTVTPAVGELALSNPTPAVFVSNGLVTVAPSVGQITLTGPAPTVTVVGFGGGSPYGLLFLLTQPIAGAGVVPGVGQLTLTGPAPTIAVTGNPTVLPGVGELTLTGPAPTVLAGVGGADGSPIGLLLALTKSGTNIGSPMGLLLALTKPS
jgi:hypothetical protein